MLANTGLVFPELLGKKIKFNNTLDLTLKLFYASRKVQVRKKSCQPLEKEANEEIVLGVAEKKSKRGKKKKEITVESQEVKIRDIDTEALWRDNLSTDNLKLFYKTNKGSYRKINDDESFEKLKSVLNEKETDTQDEKFKKVTVTIEVPCGKNAPTGPKQPSNLRLPDLIIRNMTNFPMIRCGTSEPETLTEELKNAEVNSYPFPAVTRILNETKSEESAKALIKWEQKMIAKLGEKGFLTYREDSYAFPLIPGVSSPFRKKYFDIPYRKRKQIVTALLNRGTKFHSCIKQYLESKDERAVELDEDTEKVWHSLEKVLTKISDVRAIETNLAHPILLYKGIVDCVASYEDTPCVIEWKKSDRKKGNISSTYDAPLQCCAYLGALAWSKTSKNPVTNGLVVVGYTDGSPADVYKLDPETCNTYWLHWLQRLQQYWVLNSSKNK